MSDENKHNILFFENSSMQGLFDTMVSWQNTNQKRFLSMSIQKDGENFCCIALTNPTEVVITDRFNEGYVDITHGALCVKTI